MLKRRFLSPLAEELFCQEMAFLLRGGVSLVEAIEILANQTLDQKRRSFLEQVGTAIKNGSTLADSLNQPTIKASITTRNIIAIGEQTGSLANSLLEAASYLNKQASLKRKLITALIYPLLTILVTLLVGGGIMFYVFPKILPVIESLNIPLPWTTRTLIALHHFLNNYFLFLLISIIVITIASGYAYRRQKKFRYHVDRLTFATPLFGKLLKTYELAIITRHLGLLMNNHATLSEAWAITTKNIKNEYLQTLAHQFQAPLDEGKTLSSLWQKYSSVFPPIISQFIAVSEASGCLPNSLIDVADRFEETVDHITKTASSLVEPILMSIIGISIGFLALAILSPIYEITTHLNQ